MDDRELLHLTTAIVSAYVENNRLSADGIPGLIGTVQTALRSLEDGAPAEQPPGPTSAEIKRSIRPDGLVSFLDSKTYRTLKRHLSTQGLTPAQYRERFGLPDSYPMVAASYSAARSQLAKAAGLGQGGRQQKGARAKT
jgi:predicted transcriptional regulator